MAAPPTSPMFRPPTPLKDLMAVESLLRPPLKVVAGLTDLAEREKTLRDLFDVMKKAGFR